MNFLQAQERACAKSCLGASWKWSSVFMGLGVRLEFRLARSFLWLLGTNRALKMVASQRCLSVHYRETISLLLACTSLRALFMGIIAVMISEHGTAGPPNAYTVSSDG